MTAAKRRGRFLWTIARSSMSNDGWTGYAPLGRPSTRRERMRSAWHGSRAARLLHLPDVLRHANAQYVD